MNTEVESNQLDTYMPITSITSHVGEEIAPDLFFYNIQIVNICLVGNKKSWVLVDAGMPKSADVIFSLVEDRFGSSSRPQAIVLTHGHFDHVGAIAELIKHWNVPVYAHELEIPYLTGQKSYPEPDPTVEGGILAKISALFPNEPINLGGHVHKLSGDGKVPHMQGWRWIHTPGHTPGHISLFREQDRALIAGDAFVTVRQDSLYKVLTQEQEINGPPRYFTTDWKAARESVKKIRDLHPSVAVTGHGTPMSGDLLTENLDKLVREFDRTAVPDYGRFIP
jgi:glyoxylase-like metal-dependent hydrolase (beta-lactamase superfamily II)